jgi:hypothetical protein
VERGHEWFIEYQCGNCHGAGGGGGGALFVEARSGISTRWAAPSINDVLFRYTKDETRYWIVYGRAGTPMPAWGAEGGGPLNTPADRRVARLPGEHQIPQSSAGAVDNGSIGTDPLSRAPTPRWRRRSPPRAAIAAWRPFGQFDAIRDLRGIESPLHRPSTCTRRSAALFTQACDATLRTAIVMGLRRHGSISAGLVAQIVAFAPPRRRDAIEARVRPDLAFSIERGDADRRPGQRSC